MQTTDIRKGLKIQIDGVPYAVVEHQFVKPGKGQAFTRCRIRNLATGAVIERTWKSGESVEIADVDTRKMTYSWDEGDSLVFMETSTGEQIHVMKDKVGDEVRFLSEGLDCEVTIYNGNAIGIELPPSVVLQMTESEPGIKGDTASGATKPAKLSTGRRRQRAALHQGGRVGQDRHAHRRLPGARQQVGRLPAYCTPAEFRSILTPMEWTRRPGPRSRWTREIGSYQEDFEPTRDPIVESDEHRIRSPADPHPLERERGRDRAARSARVLLARPSKSTATGGSTAVDAARSRAPLPASRACRRHHDARADAIARRRLARDGPAGRRARPSIRGRSTPSIVGDASKLDAAGHRPPAGGRGAFSRPAPRAHAPARRAPDARRPGRPGSPAARSRWPPSSSRRAASRGRSAGRTTSRPTMAAPTVPGDRSACRSRRRASTSGG